MNVAQVVLTLDVGGLEYIVIQLSEYLERLGIGSPIVVLTQGALVDEARRRGLRTTTLGKSPHGFDLRTAVALRRFVKTERIDLLHTHNMGPLIYGTLAAVLTGSKVINTRHGRAALKAPRLIWRLADRVVAVSEDGRRELLKHNAVPAAKLSVVLNGIDVSGFRRSAGVSPVRRELGLSDGVPIVATVGRLAREKDHATLLRAFRQVIDRGYRAHLLIAGGGELDAELRQLCLELRLETCVSFLGFRSDVKDLLSEVDLFVLSSRMEGISLTLLEAMAAGKPIVATAVGGNPEVVVDGRTGLLVPPANPEALADAITMLIADTSTARSFGAAGRRRAEALFSVEQMGQAYLSLYRDVLGSR